MVAAGVYFHDPSASVTVKLKWNSTPQCGEWIYISLASELTQ